MTPFVSKITSNTNSLSGSIKGSLNDLVPQFPTTGPITKVNNSLDSSPTSLSPTNNTDSQLLINELTSNRLTHLNQTNSVMSHSNNRKQFNLVKHTIANRKSTPKSVDCRANYHTPESRKKQRTSRLKLSASRPELNRVDCLDSKLESLNRSSSMVDLNQSTLSSIGANGQISYSARKKPNKQTNGCLSNYANSTCSSAQKQKEKFKIKSPISNSLQTPYRYQANRL